MISLIAKEAVESGDQESESRREWTSLQLSNPMRLRSVVQKENLNAMSLPKVSCISNLGWKNSMSKWPRFSLSNYPFELDFTVLTSSVSPISSPCLSGMDSDEVEATSQITQLSQRGLKRSLSPLVPLATSFAEETIGTRARSASIQSSQYPFYQASNLSSLKVPRQLGHSSSVTDFSSSSYSARLQRVASEATLERLRLGKGDDHEDLDSSPPSTPSHGSFGDKTLNQGGSNRISLISRLRIYLL